MFTKKNRIVILLLTLLLWVPMAVTAGGNPALESLNAEIIFCLSFDDEAVLPDLSQGAAEPLKTTGQASFVDGVHGKALLLGGENGIDITYRSAGNLDLTKPGALSFWIAPDNWLQPSEEVKERPYLRFFQLQGTGAGHFFIQRMGFANKMQPDGKLLKRNDKFMAGLHAFADWKKQLLVLPHDTLKWKDGEWRFVVITWDRQSMNLIINGKVESQIHYPRVLDEKDFADEKKTCSFRIGTGESKETTRLDEFIVYRRFLSEEEIQKLYQAGISAIK